MQMTRRGGCSFNCRERALLPWLFLAGVLVFIVLHVVANGKARASALEQPAPAPASIK